MGNFQQHITCSTITGIGVAGVAYHFGFSASTCLVSAGLCSFAGMLPDIDSDTSKSFQECIYLTAGIGCILTASRLRHFVDPDFAMLGGAFIFLLIRFGLAPLIKKMTVHRGMIHSIPMAILAGELVFFAVPGMLSERLVKAAALTIGFLSHLILDEVYSIDSTGATLRIKKSFGTALKWTNPKKQGAVTLLYSSIILLGFAACSSLDMIEQPSGNVAVAGQTSPSSATLWQQLFGAAKNAPSLLQEEIQREAAEFLLRQEQGSVSMAAQPYTAAVAKQGNSAVPLFLRELAPMIPTSAPESELPSAMQIGHDWDRHVPIQPAPIVLQ
jgi:membrane-bound metal-dependent hydrolase YbcI (DUF457 family)